MNANNNLYYLVLNSIEYFYIFQLSQEGVLSYRIYDFKYNLIEKDIFTNDKVLNFSMALDDSNNLNIVYLLKTGELYHKVLHNSKWIGSIIGKYDTVSNRYNKLKILFIENKLNIIYSYSNLIASNIYTIQHIVYDQSVQEQHNVVKYVSSRLGDPFTVDYDDSGTIHLLYNAITNRESYIYHCFYSPYRKAWSVNPQELSTPETKNIKPYLFIDSSSNIHSLWLENKKNHYSLQYKTMATKGRNKYNWNSIKIPYRLSKDDSPIIFEANNNLKISLISHKENCILYPKGPSNSWVKEDFLQADLLGDKYFLNTVISNKTYPNTKGNHSFGKLDKNPYIYIINNVINPKHKDNHPIPLNSQSSPHNQKEKSEQVDFSQEELILNEIESLKENQANLKALIDNLLIQEAQIQNELKSLKDTIKENQSSFLGRLFNKY